MPRIGGRRVARLAVDSPDRTERRTGPVVSPLVAALTGGAGVAAAGYLLALGVAALGWLQASSDPFQSAMRAGGAFWLLAHGARTTLGGVRVGIIPLGFSAIIAVMGAGAAGFAATQQRLAHEQAASRRGSGVDRGPRRSLRDATLRTTGLFLAGYLLALFLLGAISGSGSQTIGAVPGAVLLAGGSALTGASRGLRWRFWRSWPGWARAIPAAAASALLTLGVGASLVAGIAFLQHWRRVMSLQDALHAGASGGFVLLVAQLAYLPNVILWAGSWLLGAGVSIGQDSLVTPMATQLGYLPAIPALGALPPAGVGDGRELGWLAVGVLAGALAAVTVALSRRRARFDEVAVVGALAGIICGLLFAVLAALSAGPLGTERLSHVGPRLAALFVLAPTVLGLSGLLTGLVLGLVRRPEPAPDDGGLDTGDSDNDDPDEDVVDDEPADDPGRRGGGAHAAGPR